MGNKQALCCCFGDRKEPGGLTDNENEDNNINNNDDNKVKNIKNITNLNQNLKAFETQSSNTVFNDTQLEYQKNEKLKTRNNKNLLSGNNSNNNMFNSSIPKLRRTLLECGFLFIWQR